jgi:hypothetical protein
MENSRFLEIFLKFKFSTKTGISRNCEHFQGKKNLGSFETSHGNNFVTISLTPKIDSSRSSEIELAHITSALWSLAEI